MKSSAYGAAQGTSQRTKSGGRTRGGAAFHAASLATLVVCPWVVFVVIASSFAYLYFMAKVLVWVITISCLALSAVFYVVSRGQNTQGPMYMYLAFLCFLATIVGAVVGIYIFATFTGHWWILQTRPIHTNLLPTEPASAHSDAASLSFSLGSRLDSTKVFGYHDRSTYCVAPILDDTQEKDVQYWAAGIGCCKQRTDFFCDDALDVNAHAGVVIYQEEDLFWKGDQLLFTGYDNFVLAAKAAASAYGLNTPDKPIFVLWSKDPRDVEDKMWFTGMLVLLFAVIGGLVLFILLGALLHMMSQRQAAQ